MDESGQAVASNIDRRHQVEPEQGQVGQVILGQLLTRKVSMQAAKSPESAFSDTHALEVRKDNAASISDDDMFDVAFSVYKHAHLPVDLVRQFGELPRELLSDDLPRRDASLVELVEALNLIRLQSLYVSFDGAYNSLLQFADGWQHSTPRKGNANFEMRNGKGKRGISNFELRISKCEFRIANLPAIQISQFEIRISPSPFPLAKGGCLG